MASYREIIEGLTLMASLPGQDMDAPDNVRAEHDEIYAGPDPDNTPRDVAYKLKALGWCPDGAGCWQKFT